MIIINERMQLNERWTTKSSDSSATVPYMATLSVTFSVNGTKATHQRFGAKCRLTTIAGSGSGRGHRAGDGAGDGPRR